MFGREPWRHDRSKCRWHIDADPSGTHAGAGRSDRGCCAGEVQSASSQIPEYGARDLDRMPLAVTAAHVVANSSVNASTGHAGRPPARRPAVKCPDRVDPVQACMRRSRGWPHAPRGTKEAKMKAHG